MKCPLCGSRGEMLLTSYACSAPGCRNFVPDEAPPIGPVPEQFKVQYDYRWAGAPEGSRTWAKHQHALGRELQYQTTYMGHPSGWHTPDPAGADVDPSWPGFDAADPKHPSKEPALEVEWRLAP